MNDLKNHRVSIRLTQAQLELVQKLIDEGKAKNTAAAVQLMVSHYQITQG